MEFLKHYEKQERAIESRKMKKKIIWEEEKGGGAQIEFLSDVFHNINIYSIMINSIWDVFVTLIVQHVYTHNVQSMLWVDIIGFILYIYNSEVI